SEIWTGGTNPDEAGYFGWAQIYYETGKTYIPLEEIGPNKIQHIDFYIGESPETSIFAKVDISKQECQIWEIKNRTVTVTVYDGNNKGLVGVYIEITNEGKNLRWSGFSGKDGKFIIENVPPDVYVVNVTKDLPIKINFSTIFFNFNYPIVAYVNVKNWSRNNVELNLHVDHYINPNLKDADVYFGFDWQKSEPIGRTDARGNYSFHLSGQPNIYHITVIKKTDGIYPPSGSVVVNVDGKCAVANRWAPGYCYLIIPFWISNMIFFINVFMCAIACISTYFIARRLYDHKTGVISTILIMVCGIAMVMIYARGMADYASMAFATMGVALSLESIQKDMMKSRTVLNLFLGFLGGLSIAFAVTMRYSMIVILIGPLIYGAIKFIRIPKHLRFITTKKALPFILMFILGLSVIGGLLANYNATLFGGPLNSGYQMGHTVEVVDGNATVVAAEQTMFEQYFNPSSDMIQNIVNRILPQLLFLLPTLFIAPLGLFLDFRKSRAWLLSFWIIPVLVIYMQLSWVGQVPIEDIRYFLPVLPPTAILSAYAINESTKNQANEKNRFFSIVLLGLLIIAGFLIGYCGIYSELHRNEPKPILMSIGILLVILAYLLTSSKVLSNAFRNWKEKHKRV
ncbi:MAG TPA: hypothetical protein ENI51_04525, partial [Candidatus Atribacteria bacterium]|nr:hypothetical protein [Candidatus Atribacteria bacterium]